MISDKRSAMPTYGITAPPSSMTCKTTRGSLNAKAYTISSLQMVIEGCVERMEHEREQLVILIFPASLLFRTHRQAAGCSSGIVIKLLALLGMLFASSLLTCLTSTLVPGNEN